MMWKSLVILMVAVPAVFCVCKHERQMHAVKNLKINEVEGIWFNQYDKTGDNNSFETEDASCETFNFLVEDDGETVVIVNIGLAKRESTYDRAVFYTKAKWSGGDGKFTRTATISGKKIEFLEMIIGTDYKNFLINYSCIKGSEYNSIMTRKMGPVNEELKKTIEEALSANNLTMDQFTVSGQEGCIH